MALQNELEKKILSASSIDLQESLAASVTYLYLKNFKALCVILNHLIEAHISDKAFTPRFLSKVNKMKRKVTYSYEERNQIKVGSENPIDLGKATSADIKVILTFRLSSKT